MLMETSAVVGMRVNAWLVNWLPWSVLKISGVPWRASASSVPQDRLVARFRWAQLNAGDDIQQQALSSPGLRPHCSPIFIKRPSAPLCFINI